MAGAKSSRTRWILVGVAVVGVIAAVMGVMLTVVLGSTGLGFVKQHSGLDLPGNVSEVDTFDDGETFVVAHVRLPDVAAFVQAHPFEGPADPDALRPYVESLRPAHRALPSGPDVVGASGVQGENHWDAVLDESDGELWIVVRYPDFAGDPPG